MRVVDVPALVIAGGNLVAVDEHLHRRAVVRPGNVVPLAFVAADGAGGGVEVGEVALAVVVAAVLRLRHPVLHRVHGLHASYQN